MRQAFPSATILKPSVLVGTEDRMFNSFARLAMNLPYLPLTGRDAQVQVHCFAIYNSSLLNCVVDGQPHNWSHGLVTCDDRWAAHAPPDLCCVGPQPVYVRDVTEALEAILKDKGTIGKTYALAGPRTYTYACTPHQPLVLLHAHQLLCFRDLQPQ